MSADVIRCNERALRWDCCNLPYADTEILYSGEQFNA